MENKTILKNLIVSLLNELGHSTKVKLAKLVLFSDIEYFKKTGNSITGLYYVRLRNGPVVAFFDEVLENNLGELWNLTLQDITIHGEKLPKKQHLYSPLIKSNVDQEIAKTIKHVVKKYGSKSGTKLSEISHSLPAWRFSEPNEPIFITELSIEKENEYFALIDYLEDSNDDDTDLAKKIPSPL
ncbi:MAG: SocA family protein [Candidatus Aureabacteria bacterium]|nr:SocA family protein [Candidatus Auribacterota bacterium]MCK5160155.1 SocA family protein [Candidatus Auribacterota bacterium]